MDYIWVKRALNLIHFTYLVVVIACKWYKLLSKTQINQS